MVEQGFRDEWNPFTEEPIRLPMRFGDALTSGGRNYDKELNLEVLGIIALAGTLMTIMFGIVSGNFVPFGFITAVDGLGLVGIRAYGAIRRRRHSA